MWIDRHHSISWSCFGRASVQARRCRASRRWNSSANERTPRRCDPSGATKRADENVCENGDPRDVQSKNECDVDVPVVDENVPRRLENASMLKNKMADAVCGALHGFETCET